MGKSEDIATEKNLQESSQTERQTVNDVHFGIFFDGTNNNMVQQAYYHTYKDFQKRNINIKDLQNGYNEIETLFKQLNNVELELADIYRHMQQSAERGDDTKYYEIEAGKKEKEIKDIRDKIQDKQVHSKISTKSLHVDSNNAYSNIAILHSILKESPTVSNALYHNLYIEGSGANDILEAKTTGEKNINGLGFGLGKTGVSALVSKAIYYVRLFLKTNKSRLSDKTNYHFYVFGFSRGATCARLFTELTVRNEGEKLDREDEFGQVTSKVNDIFDTSQKRIPFMERDFIEGLIINKKNVTVDFLGIYDTVASIGFLKQKDGWTNVLSLAYRANPFSYNYHGNYHYQNVHDYGLFSPQRTDKVLHTCHICGADEFRENFALVNLGKKVPNNAMEIIIPGCHADVGGGYVTETGMDIVLYKFIPRKFEHFIKSNKITEIAGFAYLRYIKERAKMFLSDPFNSKGETGELSPNTLAKLGWIGREWRKDPNVCFMEELAEDNKPYTIRMVDWQNEIHFKRHVIGGYSNIPLNMMKKCVEECNIKWLFEEKTTPYDIPSDLKELGENMMNQIKVPSGERIWIIPQGGYAGEAYRQLRLKYLHFSASCEIMHIRSKVNNNNVHTQKDKEINPIQLDIDLANFGNNCNYDNNATICRIMYDGDPVLIGNHEENVHYMYDYGEGYGLKEIEIFGYGK